MTIGTSVETTVRSIGFVGMIIIDIVVGVAILLPVSAIEIVTDTELGTYNAAEKLYKITIQIGTGD